MLLLTIEKQTFYQIAITDQWDTYRSTEQWNSNRELWLKMAIDTLYYPYRQLYTRACRYVRVIKD